MRNHGLNNQQTAKRMPRQNTVTGGSVLFVHKRFQLFFQKLNKIFCATTVFKQRFAIQRTFYRRFCWGKISGAIGIFNSNNDAFRNCSERIFGKIIRHWCEKFEIHFAIQKINNRITGRFYRGILIAFGKMNKNLPLFL